MENSIKFDKSKFSRKRYRRGIKTLRKHLKWDGLELSENCKIRFKIEEQKSLPIIITDETTIHYYNTKTGKLIETKLISEIPLIVLE